jgi:hypothetical protein
MPLGVLKYNGSPFGITAIVREQEDMMLFKVLHAWHTTFGARAIPDMSLIPKQNT